MVGDCLYEGARLGVEAETIEAMEEIEFAAFVQGEFETLKEIGQHLDIFVFGVVVGALAGAVGCFVDEGFVAGFGDVFGCGFAGKVEVIEGAGGLEDGVDRGVGDGQAAVDGLGFDGGVRWGGDDFFSVVDGGAILVNFVAVTRDVQAGAVELEGDGGGGGGCEAAGPEVRRGPGSAIGRGWRP